MNFEFFLKTVMETIVGDFPKDTVIRESDLYKSEEIGTADDRIPVLLGYFHKLFNEMFELLNGKIEKYTDNLIYIKSEESRHYARNIDLFIEFRNGMKDQGLLFSLPKDYQSNLDFLNTFLNKNGGTEIPKEQVINLKKVKILKYSPIFIFSDVRTIKSGFNKQVITRQLGSGSYANVKYYKDEFYNIRVAIKSARKDLSDKEIVRFKQEYKTMSELDSPYIAKVYRYDDMNDEFYMEYLEYTLLKYIQKNPELSVHVRKRIVNQIFSGLEYLHLKKQFHRDLSYTNIMLNEYDDGSIVVKLLDLGYVKLKDSTLTSNNSEFIGSLNDSKLEIIGMNNYNIQHEVYALSQVICFVMTGKRQFSKLKGEQLEFLNFGMDGDLNKRAKDMKELKEKYLNTDWSRK